MASYQSGSIVETYKGYLNVPCIFYSVAIFVGLRYLKSEKALKVLNYITKPFANLAYGIYLVQWLVFIVKGELIPKPLEAPMHIIVASFVIYGICAGVVFVLSKLPVLRNIV